MGNPEYFADRIASFALCNQLVSPISVEIDLTNKCNQFCYYCNSKKYREDYPDKANTADYYDLLSALKGLELSSMGRVSTIIFSGGGDPCLNPESGYIISHAASMFRVGVVTNGLNLQQLEGILHVPTWVGVDIDSVEESSYKSIRGTDLFKVLSNIKYVMAELQSRGTKFTFKFLLNKYNNTLEHISDSIIKAKELGFNEFFIRIASLEDKVIIPLSGCINTSEISEDVIKEYNYSCKMLEQVVMSECNSAGITPVMSLSKHSKHINRSVNNTKISRCFAPIFLPVFGSDGSIWFCCENRGNPDMSIGNWLQDSIEPLFSDELRNKMMNFNYNCDKMCRYYNYNEFAEHFLNNREYNYDFF